MRHAAKNGLLLLGMAVAAFTAGCNTNLTALTSPPPERTAEIDDVEETITISKGVALGFECTFQGGACSAMVATTDAPNVARVFSAYVDSLHEQGYSQQEGNPGPQPSSVFVVVGQEVGRTTLHLDGEETGDSDEYTIIVVP